MLVLGITQKAVALPFEKESDFYITAVLTASCDQAPEGDCRGDAEIECGTVLGGKSRKTKGPHWPE